MVDNLDYPEDILDFDLSDNSKELSVCMNNAVFDIDKGLLLKLGEGKEVLAALKGRKAMSQEEIQEVYGSPTPKFERIDWPKLSSPTSAEGPSFYTLSTYFAAARAAQIVMGVEMINQGKIEKTYAELFKDICKTVKHHFKHFTETEVQSCKDFGTYFPALAKEPEKYIVRQHGLKEVLKDLRAKKMFVFLLTNSHVEHTEMVMTVSLGKDWREAFDVVCCNANKPEFFQLKRPFYVADGSRPD